MSDELVFTVAAKLWRPGSAIGSDDYVPIPICQVRAPDILTVSRALARRGRLSVEDSWEITETPPPIPLVALADLRKRALEQAKDLR